MVLYNELSWYEDDRNCVNPDLGDIGLFLYISVESDRPPVGSILTLSEFPSIVWFVNRYAGDGNANLQTVNKQPHGLSANEKKSCLGGTFQLQDGADAPVVAPAAPGTAVEYISGMTLCKMKGLGDECLCAELARRRLSTDGATVDLARRLQTAELKDQQQALRSSVSRPVSPVGRPAHTAPPQRRTRRRTCDSRPNTAPAPAGECWPGEGPKAEQIDKTEPKAEPGR